MIIRKLICPDSVRGFMEGSGAGSGGGGDQRNKDIEGRSSRPSGGGNVFGVDGVSKTGSTAQDAAIGYTSGEGTGRAGANFAALQGATRETIDKAVAASQAAKQQGADIAGQQQAAGAALGVSRPSSSVQRDEGGVRAQPPIGQAIPGITGTGSFLIGNQARPPIDPSMRDLTNMQLARQFDNPAAAYELQRRAEAGDEQAARDLANRNPAQMFIQNMQSGIDDIERIKDIGEDLFDTSVVPLPPVKPAQFLPDRLRTTSSDSSISAEEVLGVPLPPVKPAGISALASDQIGPPAAQMQQIGPATQAVQGEFYGEDLQQPDIFGTPGGEFTGLYGFPDATALGEFQTQAMRPSKAVSQLMDFSLLSQGIGALTGKDPSEAALEGGRQSLRDIFAAGGQFNPETGRVEAQLPKGQLQMNRLGVTTYSGMPDPNYTGPFANLVNPPEQERGGPAPVASVIEEQPVVDPCPPGFALVDGVCQPTDQTSGTTTGVLNPPVPPVFQPTYQPFQPQPLNPFVLSPTGAALGRSV